jgi:hypothetical protein
MTDLIERVDAAFSEGSGDDGTHLTETQKDGGPAGTAEGGTTRPLHIVGAVAAAGSAVVLFAMSSGHLHGGWATAGIVAALAQAAVAIGALSRPTRALFGAAVVANILIAAFWAATTSHGVSWATAGIGIGLSALVVIVAALLAWHPTLGSTWSSGTSVIGSVVPVAVVIVAIAALFTTGTSAPSTAPSAAGHGAAAGGGGSSTAALAEAGTIKVPGENSKTFASVLAGNSTEKAENAKYVPLDAKDQTVLTQQLSEAYQAAMRFPTVASAKAAGMILAGGMAPGVGAHYQLINADIFKGINADGSINALYPASWIYSSVADNAPVVGVMFESLNDAAPSGFVGPNDHWHRHSNLCVQYTGNKIAVPFAADQDVSPQECADVHGQFMKKTVWMVHAWVVPGWESPQGVFSHDNLHVYCPGNTDLTNAIGFCDRQS